MREALKEKFRAFSISCSGFPNSVLGVSAIVDGYRYAATLIPSTIASSQM